MTVAAAIVPGGLTETPANVGYMETVGIEPTQHSRRVHPEHQERRSRSNCECGSPCFYCATPLVDLPHDHDHFPVAWRHGGRTTVPACRRCHLLKDSHPFKRWSPAAHDAAAAGMSPLGAAAVAMWSSIIDGPSDIELGDRAALALLVERAVGECTTPEARVALAVMFNVALDYAANEERR